MYVDPNDVDFELRNNNSERIFSLSIPSHVYEELENEAFKSNQTTEEFLLEALFDSDSLVNFIKRIESNI